MRWFAPSKPPSPHFSWVEVIGNSGYARVPLGPTPIGLGRIVLTPRRNAIKHAANLERLRSRGLGHKRSLAQREYALGLEALDRSARGEPLWRVHQCVFAVLALESEPVDPRL